MKYFYLFFQFLAFNIPSFAQTVIQMKEVGGILTIPCTVNGVELTFIFDTGASKVSISLTEAIFMYKNGHLADEDILGKEYYVIANGELAEGTEIILRTVEIGNRKLTNVRASVIHKLDAPLLFGQSALNKLGKISIDYESNTLTILDSPTQSLEQHDINYHSGTAPQNNSDLFNGDYLFITSLNNPAYKPYLKNLPSASALNIYSIPKDAVIYILDNSDSNFFKIYVDGRVGFIRSYWLKRKK